MYYPETLPLAAEDSQLPITDSGTMDVRVNDALPDVGRDMTQPVDAADASQLLDMNSADGSAIDMNSDMGLATTNCLRTGDAIGCL